MITNKQLDDAVRGLDPHDWHKFAGRIEAIDPILGVTITLHADAADGNSPDVSEWPRHTMDDAAALAADGITTTEAATTWWQDRYTR